MTRNVLSCLVILTKVLVFSTAAQGDGLLSKVGEEVRQKKKQEGHEDRPKKEKGGLLQNVLKQSHSNEEDHDRHSNKRRKKKKRSRNVQPVNYFSLVAFDEPHTYCYEPHLGYVAAPLVVEQTSEVYEPVVRKPQYPCDDGFTDGTPAIVNCDWFSCWNARLTASGGTDFDNISKFGFGLLLQPTGGIGLDTSVATFRETGATFRDHLWLGDVNLMFEPLATNDIRGRLGIGINWLGDNWGGAAGFNLTCGFDLKLSDRWLLVGEGDIGSLGQSDFLHGEISLVRKFDVAGIAFGFQYYDIGGVEINSFFSGLEFRF